MISAQSNPYKPPLLLLDSLKEDTLIAVKKTTFRGSELDITVKRETAIDY
jgi:hypothetical protein